MTVQEVATLISTIGFPIVCCGVLMYCYNNTLRELTDSINSMNDNMIVVLEYLRKEKE